MKRLTARKLNAIANALAFVLAADGIDGDETPTQDYEHAAEWVGQQIRKRRNETCIRLDADRVMGGDRS